MIYLYRSNAIIDVYPTATDKNGIHLPMFERYDQRHYFLYNDKVWYYRSDFNRHTYFGYVDDVILDINKWEIFKENIKTLIKGQPLFDENIAYTYHYKNNPNIEEYVDSYKNDVRSYVEMLLRRDNNLKIILND